MGQKKKKKKNKFEASQNVIIIIYITIIHNILFSHENSEATLPNTECNVHVRIDRYHCIFMEIECL